LTESREENIKEKKRGYENEEDEVSSVVPGLLYYVSPMK
jgi:hypothetical protein